jgi:hypothetical protein
MPTLKGRAPTFDSVIQKVLEEKVPVLRLIPARSASTIGCSMRPSASLIGWLATASSRT